MLAILILLIIPLAMTPFGYCGEGQPPGDNERLVGPSIDALLVLKHTHRVSGSCYKNEDGYIEGILMGICNGVPFAIEGTCANTFTLPGDLNSYTQEFLTYMRFPAPGTCNPKPGQTLIVVTVKEFYNSLELEEVTAKVVLMFVEVK